MRIRTVAMAVALVVPLTLGVVNVVAAHDGERHDDGNVSPDRDFGGDLYGYDGRNDPCLDNRGGSYTRRRDDYDRDYGYDPDYSPYERGDPGSYRGSYDDADSTRRGYPFPSDDSYYGSDASFDWKRDWPLLLGTVINAQIGR